MAKRRNRFYVGIKSDNTTVIIQHFTTPTSVSHPGFYVIEGPFISMRAANWRASNPTDPHYRTPHDAAKKVSQALRA